MGEPAEREIEILTADEIAAVYEGFQAGRPGDVEAVRGWIGAVVYGGNWRFGDPESITQDVQLKLLQMARAGRIREPGGFLKLVQTVSKFTCVDVYHRQRRRSEHETSAIPPEAAPDTASSAEIELEQRERLELLRYIAQRLPASCRELWALVYEQQRSTSEVARELGITANNVRVRVHRCLDKARAIGNDFISAPPSRGVER